jgi:hypothetical protein
VWKKETMISMISNTVTLHPARKDEEGESQDDSFESNDKLRHTADMDDFKRFKKKLITSLGLNMRKQTKKDTFCIQQT